jgi:hypothetical protein
MARSLLGHVRTRVSFCEGRSFRPSTDARGRPEDRAQIGAAAAKRTSQGPIFLQKNMLGRTVVASTRRVPLEFGVTVAVRRGSAKPDTRTDSAIQVVGEPSDTALDGTIEIHLVHPI